MPERSATAGSGEAEGFARSLWERSRKRRGGPPHARVLLVEDSPADRRLVTELMDGWAAVRAVSRLSEALRALGEEPFDVVLVDLFLPDAAGMPVIASLRERAPDIPIVVLTGADATLSVEALARGAQDFLSKNDLEPIALSRAVLYALERQSLLRAMEQEALRNEALARDLEQVLSVAVDAIVLLNDELCVVFANDAARAFFGAPHLDALLGRPLLDRALVERALTEEVETTLESLDGRSELDVTIRATRTRFRGEAVYHAAIRDVSARKEAERVRQRMQEGERLMALGQLAAGVAHEINNPIAFVLANLQSLERYLGERNERLDGEAFEMIHESILGARRIASIVSDLKTFARVDNETASEVRLDDVARAAINLLANRIAKQAVSVEYSLAEVPPVAAFEGRLIQVASNLLSNALDAVLSGKGTTIRIETRQRPDGTLVFAVEDDGPGMSEQVQRRAFTPFFTTKAHRGGMGLGLSVCADIARRHSGEIRLRSTVGQGTRAELCIPPRTGLEERRSSPAVSSGEYVRPQARPRILLVDDEELLRRAYRRLLAPRCEVVAVGSAREALAMLTHDRAFDLILSDVEMPGLDGPGFLRELIERDPAMGARLAFFTGGTFSPGTAKELARRDVPVLGKPLELRAVVELAESMMRKAGRAQRETKRGSSSEGS